MVSYYLPIHFMALNTILKMIIGDSHEFEAFWLVPFRKLLINQSIFIGSLPKSNQLKFWIV